MSAGPSAARLVETAATPAARARTPEPTIFLARLMMLGSTAAPAGSEVSTESEAALRSGTFARAAVGVRASRAGLAAAPATTGRPGGDSAKANDDCDSRQAASKTRKGDMPTRI